MSWRTWEITRHGHSFQTATGYNIFSLNVSYLKHQTSVSFPLLSLLSYHSSQNSLQHLFFQIAQNGRCDVNRTCREEFTSCNHVQSVRIFHFIPNISPRKSSKFSWAKLLPTDRNIIVDHQGHLLNIQSTTNEVSGNELPCNQTEWNPTMRECSDKFPKNIIQLHKIIAPSLLNICG